MRANCCARVAQRNFEFYSWKMEYLTRISVPRIRLVAIATATLTVCNLDIIHPPITFKQFHYSYCAQKLSF